MQRNRIDFVRLRHILRSNTPFDLNEPLELKFKEPKSKHMIYNFFELIIHYAIIAPFLAIYAGIFLFCAGLAIKIFYTKFKICDADAERALHRRRFRCRISKFYTAPLAKHATLIIF